MAKIANRLFFGDNLDILRDYIKDETVDLIYLDPPFNSNRDYNVLFKDQSGKKSEAQITAFTDTWEWGPTASEALYHLERHENDKVRTAVTALHALLGENAMLAYLIMMTDRLVELHRALKPTGSLYLHCDPTASHYLKIVLDAIFGVENFRNEIAWKRTSSHNDSSKKYGRIHDVIFFYTKSQKYTWNTVYQPYEESYVDKYYKHKDEDGRRYMDDNLSAAGLSGGGYTYEWKGVTKIWRVPETSMQELDSQNRIYYTRNDTARIKRYLDEMKGLPAGDIWTDISALNSQAKERLGYPTQKPSELLERIIAASSNPGDVILDPFAGCGTTVVAAQKLERQWIGIDITHLGINLLKGRLRDTFDLKPGDDYSVTGEPQHLEQAKELAENTKDGRHQFQLWAGSLVQARPFGGSGGKRGADGGIDGIILFDEASDTKKKKIIPREVIVSVKSGKNIGVSEIRDLIGTVNNSKDAVMGVYITLYPPTKPMINAALSAGMYESTLYEGRPYPKIQILTIEQLLAGADVTMPPRNVSRIQAQRYVASHDKRYNGKKLI